MLRHLRLARLRGSLIAPNSRVQDRALEYLDMLDEVEKVKSRTDMVRGLLTSKEVNFDELRFQFPEYFPPEQPKKEDPFAKAKTEDGKYDIDKVDDEDVEWGTPSSEEEDEELSRWIEERTGSVSAADLSTDQRQWQQ